MPFFGGTTTQKEIDECAKQAEEKGHRVVLLRNDVAPETVKKIPKGIHTVQFYSSIPRGILDLLALPELQHVKNVGIIGGATANVIDALPARFRIGDITVHGGDIESWSKKVRAALDRRVGPAPLALHQPRSSLGAIHNSGKNHRNDHRSHYAARNERYQSSQLNPNGFTPPTISSTDSQVGTAPLPSGVTRIMFWHLPPSASPQFFSAQPSVLSTTAPRPFVIVSASAPSTSASHQSFPSAAQPTALFAPVLAVKETDKQRVLSFEEKTPAEIAAARKLLYLNPDYISDSTEGTDESTDMDTDRPAFNVGRSSLG